MESQGKNQLRVGIFISLGLLAVLISILALGGDKSIFHKSIHLNAKLDQVQGLARGSVVSLSGMTVGNIDAIDFATENSQELVVDMKIDSRFRTRIPKDSTVEVRTQGALGDKYIYITPGTSNAGPVNEGDTLEPSKSQDIMAIISEKGAEAGKIFDVISETNTLLKSLNAGNRPEAIMRNMTEATADFKEVVREARQMIGELRSQNSGTLASSMRKLDSILGKIDRGEGSLGALINDPSVHDQLKALLGGSPRKQYFQSILQNSVEKSGK